MASDDQTPYTIDEPEGTGTAEAAESRPTDGRGWGRVSRWGRRNEETDLSPGAGMGEGAGNGTTTAVADDDFKVGGGRLGDLLAAEAYVAAMIRCYLPERARPGELAAALAALSTEGGLNATLRGAMQGAKTEMTRGLTGFHTRLGLGEAQGPKA